MSAKIRYKPLKARYIISVPREEIPKEAILVQIYVHREDLIPEESPITPEMPFFDFPRPKD